MVHTTQHVLWVNSQLRNLANMTTETLLYRTVQTVFQ